MNNVGKKCFWGLGGIACTISCKSGNIQMLPHLKCETLVIPMTCGGPQPGPWRYKAKSDRLCRHTLDCSSHAMILWQAEETE